MPRPTTIGLTGSVAAGKSAALAALGRLGAATISSDAIVHELLGTADVRDALSERWGPKVVAGGDVDRGAVGRIVFADPAELTWLEALLHPLVGERIVDWMGGLGHDTRFAVVEVPLLFEGGLAETFDTTVTITATDAVRCRRAEERGTALVTERDSRQLTQDEKATRAEHVISNDGTVEELEGALAELLEGLKSGDQPNRPETLPS